MRKPTPGATLSNLLPPHARPRRATVFGLALLIGGALLGAVHPALAQSFPDKPIRLVVPFPPGGSTDVAARLVAQEMGKSLGQPVVVENKAGNAGAIGIDMVSKSAPDGYTIGFSGSGPTVLLNLIGQPTGYNAEKDLTVLGLVGTVELLFVARNSFPANNAAELIAYAKANPGKVTYASAGVGGPVHLAWEYFSSMAGINMVHVPYKGDSPALNDLMGGVVDVGLLSVPGGSGPVKGGKVKAIGLGGSTKMKVLPDVPLVSQSGLPGYEAFTWNILVGPAGMPVAVVAKLNEALNTALKNATVHERFEELGMGPGSGSPKDALAFVAKERAKWEKIVKIPGIKLKE